MCPRSGILDLAQADLGPFTAHPMTMNQTRLLVPWCLGMFWATRVIAQADTVPFTFTDHNNILLQAVLNERDTVQLMFHSSTTGVALTTDGVKRCPTIKTDGEGTAHSWGGDASSPFSTGNTMRMGQSTWDSLLVIVDEQSGQGSDGKFGFDLFADRVLEIDHDRHLFIVHSALPPHMDDMIMWPCREDDGRLYTEATITLGDSSYTDRFMLHTGYGGTCILGTAFMDHVPTGTSLDTLGVKELSDALGNTLKNVAARVPLLAFGGTKFPDLRIQVMDRRSHFNDNVLGNDLFRRFNAVIDPRNGRMYLRTNGSMGTVFNQRF